MSKQDFSEELPAGKRFVTPKTYAKEVGYGLTSITKSINKGWLEVSEFPTIEGEFIDINKYPPEEYFKLIVNQTKNKRHAQIKTRYINQ